MDSSHEVSGTPTAELSRTEYTWTATDRLSNTATLTFHITIEAALQVPPAPAGFTAAASGTSVALSWDSRSGVTKYRVERATSSSGPWTELTSSETGTSYTTTSLSSGTAYWFRVSAYGNGTTYLEDWSDPAATSVTTGPPAPEGFTAKKVDHQSIVLKWTLRESTEEEIRYRVKGASDWSDPIDADPIASGEGAGGSSFHDVVSVLVTGLQSGTTYQFQVRSTGDGETWAANPGPWSATKEATTDCPVLTFGSATVAGQTWTVGEEITAFTLPTATGGCATVTHTLEPDLPDGVTLHSAHEVSGTPTASMTRTEYTWTATDRLSNTATLTFHITIEAALQVSPAPEGFTAEKVDHQSILLKWTLRESTEEEIRYRVKGAGDWSDPIDADPIVSGDGAGGSSFHDVVSVLVTGLQSGTTYQFQVRSTGDGETWAANPGPWSATREATTDCPVLTFGSETVAGQTWTVGEEITAFTLPTATGGCATVTHTLEPDLPDGVTLDTSHEVSGTPTAAMVETSYTWTATDRLKNTATLTFHVTIEAALQVPPAPAGFTAEKVDHQSILLKWTLRESTEEEIRYRVKGAGDWSDPINADPIVSGDGAGGSSFHDVVSVLVTDLQSGTTYQFQVRSTGDGETWAANPGPWSATKEATTDCPVLTFGSATVAGQTWTVGEEIDEFTLPTATGGCTPVGHALTPALPEGVTMDSSHEVSGTPKAELSRTEYTWTATDRLKNTAALKFDITIESATPTITIARLHPDITAVTEGEEVRFRLTANPAPTADLTVKVSVSETVKGAFLTGTVPTEVTITSGNTTADLVLQTANDAVDEPNGTIRAIVQASDSDDYNVEDPAQATVIVEDNDVQLTAPMDLTITPLPLRRARLSWTGDPRAPNADNYVIWVRKADTGHSGWTAPSVEAQTATSAVIVLDRIHGQQGMANLSPGESYEYGMRTLYDRDDSGLDDVSDPYVDSANSEFVRLIDNPILTGGSANGYSPGPGQARLQWHKIANVNEYAIKYRKLGSSAFPHTHEDWLLDADWPYYGQASTKDSIRPSNSNVVSTTISPLQIGEIYALQLIYKTPTGVQVYSARDAYVWPSSDFPSRGDRVATYPFFGHWSSKLFDYSICQNTFPSRTRSIWTNLITDAFRAWELPDDLATAGSNIVSIGQPATVDCVNTPMGILISHYNGANEVIMVDVDDIGYSDFLAETEQLILGATIDPSSIPFILLFERNRITDALPICVFGAPACVVSPTYVSFAGPQAQTDLSGEVGSVDVLISLPSFSTPNLSRPSPVRFNTCSGDQYKGYRTMVHEAGHALGLSGFSAYDVTTLTTVLGHVLGNLDNYGLYVMAHPVIPDAIMNYNDSVPIFDIADEPDCSPHPFDIMAIFALYQRVGRQ